MKLEITKYGHPVLETVAEVMGETMGALGMVVGARNSGMRWCC